MEKCVGYGKHEQFDQLIYVYIVRLYVYTHADKSNQSSFDVVINYPIKHSIVFRILRFREPNNIHGNVFIML